MKVSLNIVTPLLVLSSVVSGSLSGYGICQAGCAGIDLHEEPLWVQLHLQPYLPVIWTHHLEPANLLVYMYC
ncbi:hypothetical protein N7509_006738 [Penicillium cosmopolitanum]|uniref:Secreted protein n=1 Tax=Penicillium cosmopolitanum TaxID=1131564 RepID=A0A9W9VXH3_9EURO|nr:uncharacterized protein N7509_006738 [Penicillium cosmopolitanum]KAJ5391248.1 hypothetical protein N7509_006738 [Penicillium cosmopolitanum]